MQLEPQAVIFYVISESVGLKQRDVQNALPVRICLFLTVRM